MTASLSSNVFKSSLQMLRGGNSSRSSSPARPGSPRLSSHSPAKTPRSLSPQRNSVNAFSVEELEAPLSSRTASFSSFPSRFSDTPAGSRRPSDSGASLPRQPSFSLPNSKTRTPASPKSPSPRAPCNISDPQGTPPRPSSLLARFSTPNLMDLPPSILSPAASHAATPTAPATAEPFPDLTPDSPGAKHKQMVKLLARVGGDATRAVLFVQSPLDGVASEVAYTASELLFKSLASPTQPQQPDGPAPAPPSPTPVNPVHVNTLSVVVSTLLSGAAHAAVDLPALTAPDLGSSAPQVQVVQSVGDLTPVQRLAMRLSSVSIAAALAKAPALRAADAEDAFNVGAVAATAGVKMLLHPGTMSGAVPDFGGLLEGVLSTIQDSMEDLDLSSPAVLMTAPMGGPWGGHINLSMTKP